MLKRSPIALLLVFGITIVTTAQTPPPFLDKNASHIRAQVEDLGVGHKITVTMKNGDHYHGTISKIDSDSFEAAETDLAPASNVSSRTAGGKDASNLFDR